MYMYQLSTFAEALAECGLTHTHAPRRARININAHFISYSNSIKSVMMTFVSFLIFLLFV